MGCNGNYYEKNKLKIKEKHKQYYKKNKRKLIEYSLNRYYKKKYDVEPFTVLGKPKIISLSLSFD